MNCCFFFFLQIWNQALRQSSFSDILYRKRQRGNNGAKAMENGFINPRMPDLLGGVGEMLPHATRGP